jgi:hypothetical protein
MRVLAFDPSGNFSSREGKGSTGWALLIDGEVKDFGEISAEDYVSAEAYWYAHVNLMKNLDIHEVRNDRVVIESYKLQPGKAMVQSWSAMETPQLIGFMRMYLWEECIPVIFQDPKDKARVADDILVRAGVFELKGKKHYCLGRSTNLHMRDAIRHGIFYHRYRKDK